MKATLLQPCRISLLTMLLVAMNQQAGVAGTFGMLPWGHGNSYVFQLSSSPLESTRDA